MKDGQILVETSIRPVRRIKTIPPTQKSKETRSPMNCHPLFDSKGRKKGCANLLSFSTWFVKSFLMTGDFIFILNDEPIIELMGGMISFSYVK